MEGFHKSLDKLNSGFEMYELSDSEDETNSVCDDMGFVPIVSGTRERPDIFDDSETDRIDPYIDNKRVMASVYQLDLPNIIKSIEDLDDLMILDNIPDSKSVSEFALSSVDGNYIAVKDYLKLFCDGDSLNVLVNTYDSLQIKRLDSDMLHIILNIFKRGRSSKSIFDKVFNPKNDFDGISGKLMTLLYCSGGTLQALSVTDKLEVYEKFSLINELLIFCNSMGSGLRNAKLEASFRVDNFYLMFCDSLTATCGEVTECFNFISNTINQFVPVNDAAQLKGRKAFNKVRFYLNMIKMMILDKLPEFSDRFNFDLSMFMRLVSAFCSNTMRNSSEAFCINWIYNKFEKCIQQGYLDWYFQFPGRDFEIPELECELVDKCICHDQHPLIGARIMKRVFPKESIYYLTCCSYDSSYHDIFFQFLQVSCVKMASLYLCNSHNSKWDHGSFLNFILLTQKVNDVQERCYWRKFNHNGSVIKSYIGTPAELFILNSIGERGIDDVSGSLSLLGIPITDLMFQYVLCGMVRKIYDVLLNSEGDHFQISTDLLSGHKIHYNVARREFRSGGSKKYNKYISYLNTNYSYDVFSICK